MSYNAVGGAPLNLMADIEEKGCLAGRPAERRRTLVHPLDQNWRKRPSALSCPRDSASVVAVLTRLPDAAQFTQIKHLNAS